MNALERPARWLVSTVRYLAHRRLTVSTLGLLVVLVLGAGYLISGSLQTDPFTAQYRVNVQLAQSGGLLAGQDVTLRGVRIGRVRSVDVAGDAVIAVASIDSRVKIPADTRVQVADLSAAGEQFLDFRPDTERGPYLSDGSVLARDRTTTPVPLSTVLGDLDPTLREIDPDKLATIMHELGTGGAAGPAKLAAILDGGMFLVSTLYSVLPQTVDLLHNSRMVLTTLGQSAPGLAATAHNTAAVMNAAAAMTGGFDRLVDATPAALSAADAIIADNSPTMVALLGNLATVGQMAYLHLPALNEFFFPTQRAGSTMGAINSAFHDGGVWALAAIYPRYGCDYPVPRRAGTIPDFPEPYVNARCTDRNPSVLIRGAANAPRPPGDTTDTTPPGANPAATTDPTPRGPLTLPTPYGGAHYIPPK